MFFKLLLYQLPGHAIFFKFLVSVINHYHINRCWRSRDELIRDVLLWTPTHGHAKAGRPARTYIQQLCEDTGCCPEDLPRAMNDWEEWRERVRDIRATSAIWWWWHLYWEFWMILSPNKSWRKIFSLFCPRHCDQGLIVVIVYYFQIWHKKRTQHY